MDIKDYTLSLVYSVDGKRMACEVEASRLKGGYSDGTVSLADRCEDDGVRIVMRAKTRVELLHAKLIYSHEYSDDELFFANGYQSWTVSREYSKRDRQLGLRSLCKLPPARTFAGASGDYHFTKYAKQLYHSFTYTYLRKGGTVELFGSLSERTGYTIFYADMRDDMNLFAVVKDVEGLQLEGEYVLFDIVRCVGDYDGAFDSYFALLPVKHTGRVTHLSGYTSWYNYYQNINEKIILRDLEGLRRAGDSANIFQIDDGYETKIGDWQPDEKKFPNGMKTIVDKIHEQGLMAGLWVAPFASQFSAKLNKTHRDWLITGKNGKPLVSGIAWGGFYALDFEKEEVREYIRGIFRKVFDEWGFDMVKLDFLYAAAIYPRGGKTRGQLMCEAMDFLRECCGDKLILGCGVPLGAAFGVVDACRIGCDAETSFADKFYVAITNQEIVSTRNAINDTIFRRHLTRIFANDPDVFFLRNGGAKPAKYTMEQKRLLAKINHVFGDVLFVSDDIGEYDEERLKLLKRTYAKFDGRVLSAEYIDKNALEIAYEQGDGRIVTLTFDTVSGESL